MSEEQKEGEYSKFALLFVYLDKEASEIVDEVLKEEKDLNLAMMRIIKEWKKFKEGADNGQKAKEEGGK